MPMFWSVCDVALVHLKDDPVFADVIPSKIFEATAMGLPILLVAPSGEASEIVEGEGVGIAIRAGAPALLAEAVRRMRGDPTALARFARCSAEAARRHSRQSQAEDMLRVLTAVSRRGS